MKFNPGEQFVIFFFFCFFIGLVASYKLTAMVFWLAIPTFMLGFNIRKNFQKGKYE